MIMGTMPGPAEFDALRARKAEAITALVEAHSESLVAAALGWGFSEADAEELAQDAFVAFLESVARFEGRSSVKTFLFGILYNKAREAWRRRAREVSEEDIEKAFEERFRWGVWTRFPKGPEQEALNAELKAWLAECSERLSLRLRTAFYLKAVSGESTEEICRIMAVTPGNLGVLFFRARNALRECLEKKANA